jgi:hypothetical protein
MDTVAFVTIVIVIVVVSVIVIVGSVLLWLRRLAKRRSDEVRARYPNARHIAAGANCMGRETRSGVRGNGTLVLTDEALIFELWVVRGEHHIPLNTIRSVEIVKSHMQRSNFVSLLKVSFTNDEGNADSIAWWLPDLAATKVAIESALAA